MKNIYQHLLNWALPGRCVLCHANSKQEISLCVQCEKDIPKIQHACTRCAHPLKTNTALCGSCLKNPPAFTQTIALFQYQSPYDQLITELKFNKKLHYAKLLGELFSKKIMLNTLPDLLIPIPLHTKRLQERGFNQSLEIARTLHKALNIPVDYQSCIRAKHTVAQSSLPAKKRQNNVKNAFKIIKPIKAHHIALLDDVMTTGTTVRELSQLLIKHGVKQVDVWCIARAGI